MLANFFAPFLMMERIVFYLSLSLKVAYAVYFSLLSKIVGYISFEYSSHLFYTTFTYNLCYFSTKRPKRGTILAKPNASWIFLTKCIIFTESTQITLTDSRNFCGIIFC